MNNVFGLPLRRDVDYLSKSNCCVNIVFVQRGNLDAHGAMFFLSSPPLQCFVLLGYYVNGLWGNMRGH